MIELPHVSSEKIVKLGTTVKIAPDEKLNPEGTTFESPEIFTKDNVIKWSTHYKALTGTEHGKGIQTKAKRFIDRNCIEYVNKENGGPYYICKPIIGYNSTTYKIKSFGGKFTCDCQFYNKVCIKNPGLICSHVLATYLQIKIWNSERKKQKNINMGITTI